ncbi:MAG TPA: DNA polymerase IV [Caulobacteraceae bacterium]|jgi:DNA polymerase-4|nr:DNA polymerase IV [Caulobacteraceae bacterium]
MKALCRDCLRPLEVAPRRCPACGGPRIVAHDELDTLSIAHLDCDAFYASVEKRDRPELRDKAVIVGGETRGVVAAACYVARLKGVRSAMPMFQAKRLCPDAVVIRPDFKKYRAVSKQIFDKVRTLTPLVQSLALDEAWLDLSGTERLHGAPPALTLARLQGEIEREAGVTVSIGLAANRFLAKIASELDKPRGFAVIGMSEAAAFLAPRPVSLLPGVGVQTARLLREAGFTKIGDIAAADPGALAKRFGLLGAYLARLARGDGGRVVDPDQDRKSISAETTFFEDLTDLADLENRLHPLCERVAWLARAEDLAGRVVVLKLRHADFRIITRRRTLGEPTQTARTMFAEARSLLAPEANGRPYRLIGVGLTQLVDDPAAAADLFPSNETRARRGERAVDDLRERFGATAVINAWRLRPGDAAK